MTPTDTSSPDTGSNWLQRQWNRVRGKRTEDVVIGQVGAAADHVVIGKNIIQIGSIQVPRWLALLILVALASVVVLTGAGVYFNAQTGNDTRQVAAILAATPTPTHTPTPIPTVTPTPLPFAPAQADETLILVLPFHGNAAAESEPHQRIWRRINQELAKIPNTQTTVKIDPNVVLGYDQRAEAEALGRQYNASMVIWGEATDVAVTVNFLNLREPSFLSSDVSIDETEQTPFANPSNYAQYITTDLPGQLAFLALFAVGQAYHANGDFAAEKDAITHAISSTLTLAERPPDIADAYYRLGWLYSQSPVNFDAAIANYDQTIALNPNYAQAYNNRGMLYYDNGDLDQAIADFGQALDLDPDLAYAYNNRANAYSDRGDYDLAIADYDRAIAFDPNELYGYYNRGIAYYRKGDLDHAITDFDQALVLKPDDAQGYLNRGLAYYHKGDLDHAISDFDRSLAVDPENASLLGGVCWILAIHERAQQAKSYCERAIALDPAPDYLDSRGLTSALLGNHAAAIADFQVYVDALLADGDPDSLATAEQREAWIAALQQGENPFTDEVLEELRRE